MPTETQSQRYKAYKARQKAKGAAVMEFSAWNWRDKNLAKGRKLRNATVASVKPAKPASKTTERVGDDGIVRINGRVAHRVDLTMANGIACMTVDRVDLATTLKALSGYKANHAESEGYVSKRGEREKVYLSAKNLTNARKALVGAGLQPAF